MTDYPKLIAFPIDDIQCRVWCPWCAAWHHHGYGEAERKGWRHRAAHCGTHVVKAGRLVRRETPAPDGYLIKLVPSSRPSRHRDRPGASRTVTPL